MDIRNPAGAIPFGDLIDLRRASEIAGVTYITVLTWLREGVGGLKLRGVLVGSRWRTTPGWLAEFVAARTAQGKPRG